MLPISLAPAITRLTRGEREVLERFARRGIDGLHDEPRPCQPRSLHFKLSPDPTFVDKVRESSGSISTPPMSAV